MGAGAARRAAATRPTSRALRRAGARGAAGSLAALDDPRRLDFDLKHRSRALTEGPERAAARSYLKGIGYDDEALAKPIIGVANDLDRDDAVQLPPARARPRR